MGKPPSVVIIARHGARLDVEDKTWQSNSPAPYDPPLTYGGWTQSRALGARIASLLHARDLAAVKGEGRKERGSGDFSGSDRTPEESDQVTNAPKRRIWIHSSPYLRCVQTSIAIGAGIAQYQGNLITFGDFQAPPKLNAPRLYSPPEKSNTLDSTDAERLISQSPEADPTQSQVSRTSDLGFKKVMLRIDAFLGEWLSSEYFESIAAPPPSTIMVETAKASLLRSADPIQGVQNSQRSESDTPNKESLTQKESSASAQNVSQPLQEIKDALMELSGSLSTDDHTDTSPSISADRPTTLKLPNVGYTPPTPNYALSSSEPIPSGYVAHARDACVDIDMQWDSMREPHNWGDGGEQNEEWSSMHKRFRKGFGEMISWYKSQESQITRQHFTGEESKCIKDKEDSDTILVIVTHGAGCNALIGALTSQPVLLDVGMGSLTMAVRKDRSNASTEEKISRTISGRRKSSTIDPGLPQDYEMKLIASTDHLRAGIDPLRIPQLQSPRLMPSISEYRRVMGSRGSSGTVTPTSPPNEPASKNSALGSIRRSTFNNALAHRPNMSALVNSKPTTSPTSTGLWASPNLSPENRELFGLEEIPKLSDGSWDGLAPISREEKESAIAPSGQAPGRSSTQHGLWGSRPPMERGASRRRWTVNDQ